MDMPLATVYLYANDTMVYSVASSLSQNVDELMNVIQQLQASVYKLSSNFFFLLIIFLCLRSHLRKYFTV